MAEKNYIFLLVILFALPGCSTTENCSKNPGIGNMGSVVNTSLNEFSPTILSLPKNVKEQYPNTDTNTYFYFTATPENTTSKNEAIYRILFHEIYTGEAYSELVSDTNFPLNNTKICKGAGLPVFAWNPRTEKLDVYFAAQPVQLDKTNKDIFWSSKDLNTGIWSEPARLDSVCSKNWDSHPAISPDGTMLLFASERPGGYGGSDLWISYLRKDGEWSSPVNLGKDINTNGKDYFPSFINNYDIVFSTNGRSGERGDNDIYVAFYDTTTLLWKNPTIYNEPINSDSNEYGSTIYENNIYLSSNRKGGCGNYDIYKFQLNGPVVLEGTIRCNNPEQKLDGKIYLYDAEEDLVEIAFVRSNGDFHFSSSLQGGNKYMMDYKSDCEPNLKNLYRFTAPRTDNSIGKIIFDMHIPDINQVNAALENAIENLEREVPMFVTGYYTPNTQANLNALRSNFAYKIYGMDSRTKYIENPGEFYDKYTASVENVLEEIVDSIMKVTNVIVNECEPLNSQYSQKIIITVQGWADPRSISSAAEFVDGGIDDEIMGVKVKKSEKMTNELLSKLRAYYTAKYCYGKLAERCKPEQMQNISWLIQGNGVDNTEKIENEGKRRVSISVKYDR